MVSLVYQDNQVDRVLKEILETWDFKEHLVVMVSKDFLEVKGIGETLEPQDRMETQDLLGDLEELETRERQAGQDSLVSQVRQDKTVSKDPMDLQGLLEFLVLLVLEVRVVFQVA